MYKSDEGCSIYSNLYVNNTDKLKVEVRRSCDGSGDFVVIIGSTVMIFFTTEAEMLLFVNKLNFAVNEMIQEEGVKKDEVK